MLLTLAKLRLFFETTKHFIKKVQTAAAIRTWYVTTGTAPFVYFLILYYCKDKFELILLFSYFSNNFIVLSSGYFSSLFFTHAMKSDSLVN